MKSYIITVNGIEYDVTVEEKNGQIKNECSVATKTEQPIKKETPVSSSDTIKIEAGAAGKVIKILKKEGDQVHIADAVAILEIMKMETPVVSSTAGIISKVHVSEGQAIEAGQLLFSLKA